MKDVFVVFIVAFFTVFVHSFDRSDDDFACEGKFLHLDCPITRRLQLLSANFGRTHKTKCGSRNQTFNETNCISMVAKKIIFRKCDRRDFCSVKATSAAMGGDPCPGVLKYIDVIYKCVRFEPDPTTRPTLPTENSTVPTLPTENSTTTSPTDQGSTSVPTTVPTVHLFNGNVIKPNETNTRASMKRSNHGFFHSMLVLLVLLKDKPKHSLLSVLTGVAAGTVVVLVTVLVCVCMDKRRQKNESACFRDSDAKTGDAEDAEKNELLVSRKKGSNSDSMKTDDQVDSAFSDDDVDRRVSNDYESTSDMAYLDAYLDEYNKNRSLPRPPAGGENNQQNSEAQRMSRRAHNDGSKGRSYDYNENSFVTFSRV